MAVDVINPPVINSFDVAVPAALYYGDTVSFTWSIDNPITSLSITPNVGDVLGQGSATATVSGDTTFTITAVNSAGSDSAQVSVDTIEPPTISSFTVDDTWIVTGNSTNLNWLVVGENVSLTLSDGIDDVTGLTQYTVSPTSEETYTLTATNGSGSVNQAVTVFVSSGAAELTVFHWDREVTEHQHGFPNNTPPIENFDYTGSPNYAAGTLYFRAEVISQPTPQPNMKIQLCYWQELDGNNFGLENCAHLVNVPGDSTDPVCWSTEVKKMWKKRWQCH